MLENQPVAEDKYVLVFEADGLDDDSMIELECLKEALEEHWILHQIVYKCYFDVSRRTGCMHPERPKDPKLCQELLCVEWLKIHAKSLQPDSQSLEDADTKPNIELYVQKKHETKVLNEILPVAQARAKEMKKVAKKFGLTNVPLT
jgi:hypothetical protein